MPAEPSAGRAPAGAARPGPGGPVTSASAGRDLGFRPPLINRSFERRVVVAGIVIGAAFLLAALASTALPAADRAGGAVTGDLVLATEEIYADTGSSSPSGWISARELGLPIAHVAGYEAGNTFVLDERLVEVALATLAAAAGEAGGPARLAGRRVVAGPCVTVSRISGLQSEGEELARRWGAVAESMEGAAAAHVCALYGVPFLEIRGISNMVVDRERSSWKVEEAVAAAGEAVLALCRAFDSLSARAPEGMRS